MHRSNYLIFCQLKLIHERLNVGLVVADQLAHGPLVALGHFSLLSLDLVSLLLAEF